MSWRETLEEIGKDKELSGTDFRVLFILMAHSNDGTAEITQTKIADILLIKREQVTRAIRKLCDKGIITKEVRAGKIVGYQLSKF